MALVNCKKFLLSTRNFRNDAFPNLAQMMDGMFSSPGHPGPASAPVVVAGTAVLNPESSSSVDSGAASMSPRGGSPDDQEKEERRKAAQKVLGKQG